MYKNTTNVVRQLDIDCPETFYHICSFACVTQHLLAKVQISNNQNAGNAAL